MFRTLFDDLPDIFDARSSRRRLLRMLICVGALEITGSVAGTGAKKKHKDNTKLGRRASQLNTTPGTTGPAVGRFVSCVKAQVGKPYVWATAGPDTFDCSGLVAYCYQAATGHVITHSSYSQYRLGRSVSANRSHLALGDLVFYDTDGDGAGHVGVVVGPDRAVHALNPAMGVCEIGIKGANLGGPYLGARRLDFPNSGIQHPLTAQELRLSRRAGWPQEAVRRQAKHTRTDGTRVARNHRWERGATARLDAPIDEREDVNTVVDVAQAGVPSPGYDCMNDPFLLVPDHDGVGCAEQQPGLATPEDPLDG